MVEIGVIITLLGLAGLVYCMIKAYQARKIGLKDEELTAHLKKLVAINLGAFFFSAIGLAIVIVGVLL